MDDYNLKHSEGITLRIRKDAANNRDSVSIFIKLQTGRELTIQINKKTDTYESVKWKVCEQLGDGTIPSQVKLIYGGKEINTGIIKNPRTIVRESTLQCIITRVSGAARNNGRGRGAAAESVSNRINRLLNEKRIYNLKERSFLRDVLNSELRHHTNSTNDRLEQTIESYLLNIGRGRGAARNNGRGRGAARNNGRGRGAVAALSPNQITPNKIRNFKQMLSDNRPNNKIKSKIIQYAQNKGITNVNTAVEGYTNQELKKQAAAAELAGGAKRKPTTKKKVRKIHKGPRGGKYYISKGRKIYI